MPQQPFPNAWPCRWLFVRHIPACRCSTRCLPPGAGNGVAAAAGQVDFSPAFIWLLRDFQLRLEDNGKPITPAEYLELALLPLKGGEADIANKNKVRCPWPSLTLHALTSQHAAVGMRGLGVLQTQHKHHPASVCTQLSPQGLKCPYTLPRMCTGADVVLHMRLLFLQMRATIKSVFPDRDMAVMVRPALSEADLQRLDAMPDSKLRPEFKRVGADSSIEAQQTNLVR